MQKVKSDIKQNTFSYDNIEGKYYIYLYCNEQHIDDYYEYDFNHIIIPNDENVLLERIEDNPSNYLDYIYEPISDFEKLQAQVEYLTLLVEG